MFAAGIKTFHCQAGRHHPVSPLTANPLLDRLCRKFDQCAEWTHRNGKKLVSLVLSWCSAGDKTLFRLRTRLMLIVYRGFLRQHHGHPDKVTVRAGIPRRVPERFCVGVPAMGRTLTVVTVRCAGGA